MDGYTEITHENFAEIFGGVAKTGVKFITLHWTVGHYFQVFPDYHFNITGDGKIWMNNLGFDESGAHRALDHIGHGQVATVDPLSHAWHRNTGNIGIAACAMVGAHEPPAWSPKNLYDFPKEYGTEAISKNHLDSMTWLTAMLVRHFGLSFNAVMTHYNWAVLDNYTSERWEYRFEEPFLRAAIKEQYIATKPKGVGNE
jgi:hypothetical protein